MKRSFPLSKTTKSTRTPFSNVYSSGSSQRQSFLSESLNKSSNSKYYFGLETPHLGSSTTNSSNPGSKSNSTSKPNGGSSSVGRGSRASASGRMSATSFSNVYSSGNRQTPRPTPRVTNTPSHIQNSNIIAVVEGRGLAKGEIGIASFDLKGSELVLSQFSDSPTYVKVLTKIQILQPVEIIMPSTAFENGKMSALFEVLSDQFPYITLTTVQRKYFNENQGLEFIKQLCVPEFGTVEMDVQTKYYCLATTAALVKYIEVIQNIVFAPNSLKVVFRGGEQTMLIDGSAAVNLELVQNARHPKSNHSLCGVLNYTKTPGGARLMRSNILQPSYVLARFLDVDHLISCLIQIPKKEDMKVFEKKISSSILLKHTIELVPTLQQTLKDSNNTLFKAYYETLDDPRFNTILEEIQTVVHDETRFKKGTLNMRTQKMFAVKPNVNGLLDVARRSHCEVVDDITAIVKQEADTSGLPFTPNFNGTRGFYMQLMLNNCDERTVDHLSSKYVKVVRNKNVINCTTEDLIRLNTRLEESLEEIYFLSNIVLTEMMVKVRDLIGCLYKLAECVSMLDMLVSFAHACTLSNYVRPEFTDTLAIKQGRHPILDKIFIGEPPVGNDTYASDDSNFVMVTGPNMVTI